MLQEAEEPKGSPVDEFGHGTSPHSASGRTQPADHIQSHSYISARRDMAAPQAMMEEAIAPPAFGAHSKALLHFSLVYSSIMMVCLLFHNVPR